MAEFLAGLLVASVSGTVIAALLFLAEHLVKNRISQRSQYFSWYLVFFRMLLPFTFGGLFIWNLIPSAQGQSVRVSANAAATGIASAASAAASPTGAAGAPQGGVFAQAGPGNFGLTGNWYSLLFILWLVGAIAVFGFHVVGYIGYVRRIKASRIPVKDAAVLALFRECREKYRISRPLPLYVDPCTDTPMLCGLFRCAIVFPDKNFTPDQFRHAFLHELTHCRRHDNLLKWVTVLAVSINWFNPVAYLAAREAGRRCELSCDEAATAGFSREERISYGKTLLAVASGSDHPFALSATMSEDKRNLRERLDLLTRIRQRSRKAVIFSALLLSAIAAATALTLLVSCAGNPGSVPEPEGTAKPSAGVSSAGDSGPAAESSSAASTPPQNAPSESYLDNYLSYVQNHGFKILTNSSISLFIKLPNSFSGTINGFDIGSFLKDRNALSKQNGFDFSSYSGKVLTAYACDGEKRQPGDSELTEADGGPDTVCIVGLYDGGKMVGFWSHSFSDKDDDFSILSNYLNYVPSSPAGYSSNSNYDAHIVNTVSGIWKTKHSDISITNGWLSAVVEGDIRYVALAGSLKSNPRQGVVEVVTTHRDGTTVKSDQRFLCPGKNGALTVTEIGAKDTTMGLRDADGHTWNFHIFNGFDPKFPVEG